jgi:hypothetical protein
MTIDRKELFTLAWAIARQEQWSRRLTSVRGLFGDALRKAWHEMKRRAAIAAQRAQAAPPAAADLLAAIRDLENRERLRCADLDRLSALRREYARAAAQEAAGQPKPTSGLWTARPVQVCATSIAATPQNPARLPHAPA